MMTCARPSSALFFLGFCSFSGLAFLFLGSATPSPAQLPQPGAFSSVFSFGSSSSTIRCFSLANSFTTSMPANACATTLFCDESKFALPPAVLLSATSRMSPTSSSAPAPLPPLATFDFFTHGFAAAAALSSSLCGACDTPGRPAPFILPDCCCCCCCCWAPEAAEGVREEGLAKSSRLPNCMRPEPSSSSLSSASSRRDSS
mmetsp:Transcript_7478/g.31670  ORF Transcript_7478/g.31670 Transcript_7478/m.31670 type:complete len:202 (+) Transcript_7478:542-1147(+)